MSDQAEYQVVINGGVLDGRDVEEVVAAFSSLLKIDADKARRFFAGKKRVVKKRTDLATAEKFCNAFNKIGVDASIVPLEPEPADEIELRLPEDFESGDDAPAAEEPAAEEPVAAVEDTAAATEEAPAAEPTPLEEPAAESPPVPEFSLVEEPELDGTAPEAEVAFALPDEPEPEPEPESPQAPPVPELSLIEEPELDGGQSAESPELTLMEEPELDSGQPDARPELTLMAEPELDGGQSPDSPELSLMEEPGLDPVAPEASPELGLVEEPALDGVTPEANPDSRQAAEPTFPELSLVEEPDLDREQPEDKGEVPAAAAASAARPGAAAPASGAAQPAATAGDSGPTMVCPSCNTVQPRGEQCPGCGVFVAKVKKAQAEREAAAAAAAAAASEDELLVVDTVADGVTPRAIMAAGAAALAGALVWMGIAVVFDYEIGLVAWAIGGLVGFASAVTGARGSAAGAMCAAMALAAIIGGKFLAFQTFQASLADMMQGEEMWAGDEMQAWFEEVQVDAELYMGLDGSESALRQFMLERNYTEGYSVEEITDEEIEAFLDYDAGDLEWIAASAPSFEEWREHIQANFSDLSTDISTMDLVVESLGLIDIVFLFLGLSTAYRLGESGLRRETAGA